jgi:hypothetical protein
MKKATIMVAAVVLLSACASGSNYAPTYSYNEFRVINNSQESIRSLSVKTTATDIVLQCESIAPLGICQQRFAPRRYKESAFTIDWVFGDTVRQTSEVAVENGIRRAGRQSRLSQGRGLAFSHPFDRLVKVVEGEMFHFGFDEMIHNDWKYLGDFCVGDERDFFYQPMVVFDKTKMGDDVTETLPSRELPGAHDQAAERPFIGDKRINPVCNGSEIFLCQRALRFDDKVVVEHADSYHLSTLP